MKAQAATSNRSPRRSLGRPRPNGCPCESFGARCPGRPQDRLAGPAALLLGAVVLLGCGGSKEPAPTASAGKPFSPIAAEIPDYSAAALSPSPKTLPGATPTAPSDWVDSFAAAGPVLLARQQDPELTEAAAAGRRRIVKAKEEATAQRNWEIRFPKGQTVETYAKQLDYFGIELAVVMPEGVLLYVSRLSADKPTTRTGKAAEEKRFYLTWRGGELSLADLELLHRAGVEARNRVLLKLLPPELEKKLAELERQAAGPRADRVRKTRFDIRASDDGYQFVVVEQWFQ